MDSSGNSSSSSSATIPDAKRQEELYAFLESMKEHEPTLPDSVVTYLLESAGCSTPDLRLQRLVSLATQKFIYDVAKDARDITFHQAKKADREDPTREQVLTTEVMTAALRNNGVEVFKTPYIADTA